MSLIHRSRGHRASCNNMLRSVAGLGMLFVLAIASAADATAQSRGTELLVTSQSMAERPATGEGVVRASAVAPDLSVLAGVRDRLLADPTAASELVLTTFDQSTLTIIVTRVESVGEATAFHGTVAGIPWSSAAIVEREGVVAGNINTVEKVYQIRYRGRVAGHELREIDQSVFRDHDRDPPTPPRTPLSIGSVAAPSGLKAAQVDDGSTIDVMVVYTPAARIGSGGLASIQAEIALGISETNAAYANGGVIQRLRLVHTMETAYTEAASMSTDLVRLQNTSDGFMDEVHAARDVHGADAVSLWVESPSASCGTGYHQQVVGAYFEQYAFSVVRRLCATGNYSFGHELGHNMGLRHDVFVDADVTPFAYAHGYVDVPNKFRTVMGYPDACTAHAPPVNCTRIQYFSNPAVNYLGATTGNAATANEKLALDSTRVIFANFRASVAGGAPAITSPAAVQFYVGIGGSVSVSATGPPAPTLSASGALPGTVTFTPGTGVLAGTPTLLNVGTYPLVFTAANGNLPNATQNFTLTISPTPLCVLDLDGNGTIDPHTDGLMLMRALFNMTGDAVTNGAIGPNATRKTWAQISPLILKPGLDWDGNGTTDALTDGLMIVRAMLGKTGAGVTNKALGRLPLRSTWPLIRAYSNANCGSNFAP